MMGQLADNDILRGLTSMDKVDWGQNAVLLLLILKIACSALRKCMVSPCNKTTEVQDSDRNTGKIDQGETNESNSQGEDNSLLVIKKIYPDKNNFFFLADQGGSKGEETWRTEGRKTRTC